MSLLIGLDIGTSVLKGILVSSEGVQIARSTRNVEFLRPKPGYVEIDPEAHFRSVCELIRELASKAPSGSSIAALSMAAASGNSLLLDKNNRPLINIISWLDERALNTSRELLPDLDRAEFFRINGWRWTELFPFAQMAWHRQYAPEAYGRAARFCMNSDYLLFRLTGRWGMDPSTATTFYFQDQLEMKWHTPYLQMMGIGEDQVSEIRPSGSVLGHLSREGAQNTGLDRSTLVVLGAFDHPCAARGTGCLEVGDLLLSCGTSWVSFYPTENRELALSQVLLIDPFLRPSGPWGVMAALTAIAVNIDWWVDNVINRERENGKTRYTLLDEGAMRASPGAGGLSINPFEEIRSYSESVKERVAPFSKDQISRALMEGAVFEMRRKIEQLAAAGLKADRITMVGGPTNSPVWPRMVAEITGLEMRLLNGQTAGALGAAVLAAIGAGLFKNEREAFGAMGGTAKNLKPDPVEVDRYIEVYAEYLKAYPQSKKPVK